MVSVPSFGDSFFIAKGFQEGETHYVRFPSPHSGILFLYRKKILQSGISVRWFPSPHSGILFLLTALDGAVVIRPTCFRPLIRGFFFYVYIFQRSIICPLVV